jgi:hypothetical protein
MSRFAALQIHGEVGNKTGFFIKLVMVTMGYVDMEMAATTAMVDTLDTSSLWLHATLVS